VDDGIFASPSNFAILQVIVELQYIGFVIEDQGQITDYLGVNVEHLFMRCKFIKEITWNNNSSSFNKDSSSQLIIPCI
jgi:hypothetical protein